METSYLKTLELDKIIARAAEGCVCKEARAMLLAIEPQCDPDEVRYALEQTDAINTLLIKNGSPRFGGVEGVSQLAARAVKGGVLSMGELLMVAGALRNFQHLTSWYGSSEHDALPTDELFSVARIFLRSSASVREAVSAMASGARMALEICCSRPGSGASA